MPDRATMEAATPKCPCGLAAGAETVNCAMPMRWEHDRGVWVCERHPHMEVRPMDLTYAMLAPKHVRNRILAP